MQPHKIRLQGEDCPSFTNSKAMSDWSTPLEAEIKAKRLQLKWGKSECNKNGFPTLPFTLGLPAWIIENTIGPTIDLG